MKFNLKQIYAIVDTLTKNKGENKKELIKNLMALWFGSLSREGLANVNDLELVLDIGVVFDMTTQIKVFSNATLDELKTILNLLSNGPKYEEGEGQLRAVIGFNRNREFIRLRDNREEYACDLEHLNRFINTDLYESLSKVEQDLYIKQRDILAELCQVLNNPCYFNNRSEIE